MKIVIIVQSLDSDWLLLNNDTSGEGEGSMGVEVFLTFLDINC